MQYCGAEREATLREPYLNVQNLRQFVCEREAAQSGAEAVNRHARVRSQSQLDQLERLKGDRQRIEIEYHAREGVRAGQHACCGMRSRTEHVRGNAKRNAHNTTVQSSVL